jgi:Carboxypeptidase regulatory-like domain
MSKHSGPWHKIVRSVATIALLSVTALLSNAKAQIAGQGAISGTITDPSGAVIPGATIAATEVNTGVTTVRKSTETGYYVVSPLLPGNYVVIITAPGFQNFKQEHVTVDALQTVGLSPKLIVGSTADTVTVSTTPPALQTTNATLGGVMENSTYSELPLQITSGGPRDPTSFVQLMPGVTNGGRSGIFNGTGSGNSNEMYIEGVPQTTVDSQGDNRKLNQNLSIEAVDQFQVQTSGSSAQYQGLGVENYSIKQGTNAYHGNVNFFIRNTAFDTWGYFQPWTPVVRSNGTTGYPTSKTPEHQNELSVSLGGPILRNKLFFFGNYDRFYYRGTTNPTYQTIPTSAAQGGDFTAYAAANSGYNIYDPTTVTACTAANGGKACAYQFMGMKNGLPTANVIPTSEISSISQAMQKYLPPVANSSLTNNYLSGRVTGLDVWGFTGRIDYTLNPKQQISLISTSGVKNIPPYDYGATSVLPFPYTNGTIVTESTTTDIVKHTYTLSPHAVNQLRYGLTRFWAPIQNATNGGSITASSLGIGNLPTGQASTTFPGASFSGGVDGPSGFSAPTGYHEAVNTYTLGDEFQWVRGRHSLTFGGTFQWLQFNQSVADSASKPVSFTFSNSSTAGYNNGAINTKSGYSYASFLLGAVDSTSLYVQNFSTLGARYKAFSPYVQDDFQVTKNLTLNLGLRWDLYTPFTEAGNRWSGFSPTLINPATNSPGAMFYMGSGTGACNCSTTVNTWYKNLGPRLGFAYQATQRDIVRGAFTIMYTHSGGVGGSNAGNYNGTGQVGLTVSPSFVDSGQGGQPAFYLNPAFGNTNIPAYSTAINPTATANAGNYLVNGISPTASSVSYADPYLSGRAPYTESWNFGIQHLLTNDLTVSVDYTGNQSHFLVAGLRGYYNNQLAPQYQRLGALLKQLPTGVDSTTHQTYLQEAQAILPSIGVPYANFGGSAGTLGQMLKPFPQYSGVTDTWGDVGNSNYNALQITLAQRTWRGLSYTLNYTYARTIDDISGSRSGYPIPANVIDGGHGTLEANRIDRTVSSNQIPNNLHIFGVYSLPFGQQNQFGGKNPVVRNVIGGWKLSFIFTKVSGGPLSITGVNCQTPGSCYPSYNTSHTGPVRINSGYGKGITATTVNNVKYIDSTAFIAEPGNNGYNFGNVDRSAPYDLYNIGNYELDSGIKRQFHIYERATFTFQADALNVTNHTQFGGLGTSLSSGSFGTISKQNNNPRDWQFAGKINF